MARAHGPARASGGGGLLLLLSLVILLAAPAARAFDPDFGFYPEDARDCLYAAAKTSKCQGSTSRVLNACLCGNGGGFVDIAAECLGKNDKEDVGKVYDTMANACAASSTPLTMGQDAFEDAAKKGAAGDAKTTSSKSSTASSTTSATNTAAASPTTTSPAAAADDGNQKPKLSTAATIGIAAGVSVAGVLAIAGIAYGLVRRRKRGTAADEAHPMLPPEKYGGGGGGTNVDSPTTFLSHGPSPSLGSPGFEQHGAAKSHYSVSTFSGSMLPQQQQQQQSYTPLPTNTSPAGTPQQQQQQNFLSAWEPPTNNNGNNNTAYDPSPRNSQYVGPYAAPQGGLAELPPQTQPPPPPQQQQRPVSNVFELDSYGVEAQSTQPTVQPPAVQSPEPAMEPIAASPPPPQPQQQPPPPREYRPYVPQ
ncbi:hypothetical protein A9K55_006051 [Cordyceps militaris]|uniref:Uncharacterized protein n=1 Tax=Cordyceps militaris TaxID=73501 RepID=A0A2H4SD90_CORMI|nr:hypothetical protein A9K55_006051 [Cordyceps militaris]